jgi:biotin operon repressor
LVNKVNLTSQAEYAKQLNISRAGVQKRIKLGKEATLKIKGKTFIIN